MDGRESARDSEGYESMSLKAAAAMCSSGEDASFTITGVMVLVQDGDPCPLHPLRNEYARRRVAGFAFWLTRTESACGASSVV